MQDRQNPSNDAKDTILRGTPWDLAYLEPHAVLVHGAQAAYWVVIQPAGTLSAPVVTADGDIGTPYPEASLTMEFLGSVINKTIFRGRWSVRVVAADERGRATRRVLHRARVREDAALVHALHLHREVEAGRLPRSAAP